MYNDKNHLIKTEASIFTKPDEFLLAHVLKFSKNPNEKEFAALQDRVAEQWDMLTDQQENKYVLNVETLHQRPQSYGFSLKRGFYAKAPAFETYNGISYGIASHYSNVAAKERMHFIADRASKPSEDILLMASLYAEANFYLLDAVEDVETSPSKETLDAFIGETQSVVMMLEDHLNYVRPGVAVDIDASVDKALKSVRFNRSQAAKYAA
jgi:hypothetical protein